MPKCWEGQRLDFRTMRWILLGGEWTIALQYLALYPNIDHKYKVRYLTVRCMNLRNDVM